MIDQWRELFRILDKLPKPIPIGEDCIIPIYNGTDETIFNRWIEFFRKMDGAVQEACFDFYILRLDMIKYDRPRKDSPDPDNFCILLKGVFRNNEAQERTTADFIRHNED